MSKNNNNAHYEFLFLAWLMLNGTSTGLFVQSMRNLAAHNFHFESNTEIAYMLLHIAMMILTAQRAIYWHKKKNENQK